MAETLRVELPSYGTVIGKLSGSAECFLGIPYAIVTKRWTKPVPTGPFPGGQHDGTCYGPMCPQPQGPVTITQVAVPGHPGNPRVSEDEFACLNLNIVRPSHIKDRLPVMVWIHGGAFSVGANSELVYSGIEFVARSKNIGKPIIHVAINYRLGLFGFLASRELLGETQGESVGNYGLWDQKIALEFIKKTIEAFGGDPERITLFGESAGSASVHSHLLHGRAVFNRAICQSGVTNTVGPLPLDSPFHEGVYDALRVQMKVQDLKDLRSAASNDIIIAMQGIYPELPVSFLVDDSGLKAGFFPSKTKWNSVPNFCEAFLIGCCANEAIIMGKTFASIGPQNLQRCLASSGISKEILQAYGLNDVEAKDWDSVILALIDFNTDLAFKGPTESVKANTPADSLFAYRFERQNKWPSSPFAGVAHHTIDLLYLAGVPDHYGTEDPVTDRKISKNMIDAWVKFGNGVEPWPPYGQGQEELVIGGDGSFKMVPQNIFNNTRFSSLQAERARNPGAALYLMAALSNGVIRS